MNIFITTTLPYINGRPHIGHTFEFIFGDIIARYLRKNNDVVFNVGLDEHGLKVWEKAKELNISTEEYVENMTHIWLEFCEQFNISYDIFYKTSDQSHHNKTKTVWNLFMYSGDIYKKKYKAIYCKGCESFKTTKDLINGKCPDHNSSEYMIEREEENYFFRLTKYKQAIRNYIKDTPSFLLPEEKTIELMNLVLDAEDISISRMKIDCPWGVDVPGDEEQIIYIWMEALLNYLFAAGYFTPSFKWQNVIQICGPDNLRFQGVIFQSFLKALKIPFTNTLLVHGTILDEEGKKMSKSIGNVVDPIQQLEKFGVDAIRYYSVAGLNNYKNSSWSEIDLINKFNSEICDDFGNLISRVSHLRAINKPEIWQSDYRPDKDNPLFVAEIDKRLSVYREKWDKYDVNGAFAELNSLVKFGNSFVNETKPWTLKGEYDVWNCLSQIDYLLMEVNKEYLVIFPEKCEAIEKAFLDFKKIVPFLKLNKI